MSYMLTEKVGKVGIITFNCPDRKNAFDIPFNTELLQCLRDMEMDPEVKAVVLKGAGHCFCAGANLKGEPMTHDTQRYYMVMLGKVAKTIQNMEKPVIAMVEGFAMGGGMGLLLACDFIIMEENAKISPNFMSLGLALEVGSFVTLTQVVGPYLAKKLAFTNARMTAQECYEYGLAAYVYKADEIEEKTMEFAHMVANYPAPTMAIVKQAINYVALDKTPVSYLMEAQNTPLLAVSEEVNEFRAANAARAAAAKAKK